MGKDKYVRAPRPSVTVLTDADPIDADLLWLKQAYLLGRPFTRGGTLYIPGTRRYSDILDDLLIPVGGLKYGYAYADALRAIRESPVTITRYVGHSLGAAVAQELSHTLGGMSYGYGSPVRNDVNYADEKDIVGVFVPSRSLPNPSLLHHSVGSYV